MLCCTGYDVLVNIIIVKLVVYSNIKKKLYCLIKLQNLLKQASFKTVDALRKLTQLEYLGL